MKFQKVNKKSKLDLIQSKMGLLRVKQRGGLYPKSKEAGFTQKAKRRALPKKNLSETLKEGFQNKY